MIPYGRQNIDDEDVEAVIEALKSDFITQGERVPEFEEKLTSFTRSKFAVAANSATSCLHIACLALELGPGDTLWAPPVTFVASTNCALYCGASVDFVDIDIDTANIDPDALQSRLNQAEKNGTLPKVLVVVHMAGSPCDMKRISLLAKAFGVKVIEDASHAIGASYEGDPVGNCAYSDITVLSFHPVKIITTAEGGAALTNCARLARRMALFRSHGVTRDQEQMRAPSEGPWYYQQVCLGLNYRMTELQAALGCSQMRRLADFVDTRNELAARYNAAFEALPLDPVLPLEHTRSSYHLYLILLDGRFAGDGRRRVFDALRSDGIGVNVHYIPVHLQPYYQDLGFHQGQFPNAENYYSRTISLPMFPDLSDSQQQTVIDAVTRAVSSSQ